MNHRNPLSPFAHKAQVLMRAFSPRSPALRAALTGTTLGLAALAFAAPLITNGGSSLPEIGIDAGPALVAGTAANSGFSGTCSENLQTISLKIRHRVSGQVVEAPVVPCAGGVWQVTGIDLSGLNDGPLLLLAKHEDLAGQPTELSASLLKGSPAPRLGIDAPALIHPGNLESYRLSGTCSEEGRTIALTLNDAQGYRLAPTPLPTCSGQHWSTALSGLAALNDGVITLTVTHGEANTQGEIATLSAQALKNVALPGLSIDPLLFVKSANQTAFPVSGTCSEAQQPVSLSVSDRNKVTAYGVALCSGKGWRLPALDLSALADGELRFVATHARAQPVVRTVMQAGLKDTAATVTSNGNAATLTPSASAPLAGNSTSTKAPSSLLQTQTLSFNRLTNKTLTNLPFSVAATASSGLPVSFSSLTPLVCTATGSQGATVSLLLLGTCTLQANQAGNSQYAAATPVQQSFTVGIAAADAMMGNPAIAAGGNHTIAIKVGGTVWTWGDNKRGQLGDGSTTMHSTPVQVPGILANGVGAGASHSVALQTNGSIVAWGSNDFGQLGNGAANTTNVTSPTALVGTALPVFSAIAVGAHHTLALSGEEVWAWGANNDGQIGPTTTTPYTPTKIANLTGVIAIAAGGNYSLALMNDNTVKAWGRTGDATAGSSTPTAVAGLSNIAAIAAGRDHALALTMAGTVKAWGSNWAGQLGSSVTAPVELNFSSIVTAIRAGNGFSLALLNGGAVYAWGSNAAGQAGDLTARTVPAPKVIGNLQNIQALAAGDNHAVAITLLGNQVLAWGDNGRGQLGDGTLTFRQEAVSAIAAPTTEPSSSSIFAGAYHLMSQGSNKSWGSNWKGQLAETANLFQSSPTSATTDLVSSQTAAGAAHTLSGVKSVGDNQASELGRTLTGAPIPTWSASLGAVGGLTSVSSVAAGTRHSLASSGSVLWAWGANEAGQLGDGKTVALATATNIPVPSIMATVSNTKPMIQSLAAGASHSVALVGTKDAATTPPKISGNVYVWGSNLFGQLGVPGTTTPLPSFQNTTALTLCENNKTSAISAGWYHTVALCSGSVWTWGNNSMGQLGRVADSATNAPAAVTTLSAVTQIAAGAYHTLALNSDGVWAWGSNQYGQLGNSSTANSIVPVLIVGSKGAIAIAAGAGYSVIVKSNGETLVIGDGRDGQLGLGEIAKASAIRPTPAAAMISLAGGAAVSLSLPASLPSFTVTSSLATGKAYWLLQRSTLGAPVDLAAIKTGSSNTSCDSSCAGNGSLSTGGTLTIAPNNLTAGKAYRLFSCVSSSTDGPCTGNAASVDFTTFTTSPTILQLPTSTPTAIGTKGTTITVTRSGDSSQAATVNITDANGGLANYTLLPTTLSFAAGASSATFTITPTKLGYGKTAQLLFSLNGGSGFGSTGSITVNLKKPANLTPILMLLLD